MKSDLARSSFRTGGVLVLRLFSLAASLVLTTRILGPVEYGAYVATASLAVVLGIIPNLGSGYLLMARASKEVDAAGDTWRYGWPLTLVIGSVLGGLFVITASALTSGAIGWLSLTVMAAAELILIPLVYLLGFLLQAGHRVATGQLVTWMPIGFRVAAASACLINPRWHGIDAFIVSQALGALFGLGCALGLTSRLVALPWLPRPPTRGELTKGASYAAMHVVSANPAEVDKILAPILLGEHLAGIYSAASRVMGAMITPIAAVLLASQPRLFAHAGEPTADGHRLLIALARLAAILGVISMAILAACAPLVTLLFGASYAETAALLPWTAAAVPFLCLRLAAGTVLVALGKPLERLTFELCGILLLIPLLWIGAHAGNIVGMTLGLTIAEASMAGTGWMRIRQIERHTLRMAQNTQGASGSGSP
ncbi:lipopolysaccharide biosynthesis protein [Luteibacter sp. 3190]|uniref:lipopolysaccharide biosynthesis protein n=1 Tax=Luteibacter sp. 3190 TaxID=2817736 RepID=UPI002859B40B|nr:lipopolysaccharide biosynthesis protein [Luteibacter sp. 3190]MDR6934882.1 O-antigen/teichoic acid export membrane protein [Luteibacter sp. 3190]